MKKRKDIRTNRDSLVIRIDSDLQELLAEARSEHGSWNEAIRHLIPETTTKNLPKGYNLNKPKKTFGFRFDEDQIESIRKLDINLTDVLTEVVEKLSKTKKCPSCGTKLKKGKTK